jgi:predicted ATPase/DNA-binding winged helix-turn-helix (wHTH) protein
MTSYDTAILFGAYRLVPSERALFNSEQPVRLTGRAFDLLLALVERPGEVLSKDELIARVWPQTCVEEGNLRVHIGALRKVLHDDSGNLYVENVVGRGYSFVAPVRRVTHHGWPVMPGAARPAGHAQVQSLLPHARLIGRDETLDQLAAQLQRRRLVTVVGPGGIGKTSVALALAERVAPHFAQGVYFLDLGPLTDGSQIGSVLAVALGLPALSSGAIPGLIAHLHDMHAVLLFDNCEHVIDSAAELAERVLRDTSRVHILATSREPLRAESEWVHRLPALALPPACGAAGAAPDLVQLAASPAVQLFVERATAGTDSFHLNEDNAASVADICRRLDGIPLAIELAAGRAEFFGVQGLAARLEDCFNVLTGGRRTALPRHQTLRATLDWSHDMLLPMEQAALRRFAIFRAPFTLECAVDVARCPRIDGNDLLECIANLAAKSLISADTSGDTVLYRLLETTRAYALEKLRACGEQDMVAQRYAQRCLDFLQPSLTALGRLSTQHWLATYGRSIDHVRAVLDWAFGESGDLQLGLKLCVVSAPLWYQLSLMDEYRGRLERALERGASVLEPGEEMPLVLALGHALLHAGARAGDARRAQAFSRALALAQQLGDDASCMAALWGCYSDAIFNGDYQRAFDYAERYGDAADSSGGEMHKVAHARMLARCMHYLGDQSRARSHIEFVVRHPLDRVRYALGKGFQFDQHISSMAIQGRVLWLQGYPEQALDVARRCVDEGLQIGHGISLCFALLLACSVSTWCGDEEAGQRYAAMMLDHAQRCALPQWYFWGCGFRTAQQLLHAAPPDEAELFALQQSPYCGDLQIDVLATLHPRLLTARAIARAEAGSAGWSSAEVLRSWGEALWQAGSEEQAGQLFERALAIAGGQGAGAWELRAASSLARLRLAQGRGSEGRDALHAIHRRYAEGHATRDLRLARSLLDQIG